MANGTALLVRSEGDRSLLSVSVAMGQMLFVLSAGVAAAMSVGCGVNIATQERAPNTSIRAKAVTPLVAISVPQNPADLSIRHDLNLAIARDEELRRREISYIVNNGDISVTGIVGTEDERKRINDLAMNIGGVKSVANALRVAE